MSGNLIDRLGLWTMTHLNVDVRVLRHSPFRFYRRREYGGVAVSYTHLTLPTTPYV